MFVQKPYPRTNYIEANIEEHIDLKNQFRIKNLPLPISKGEAASKECTDDVIILGVNVSLLLRLNLNSVSKLYERDYIDHILLDSTVTSPKTLLEIPTKIYIDNKFNDPSVIRNKAHVDFNDKNLDFL